MTTATGQFAVNFAVLSNANPYTANSNLSYGTADQHQILSAAIKPTGFTNRTTQYFNGTMTGSGTVKSKIEIGANPGSSDDIQISLVRSSDGAGYVLQINGASLNLYQTNDWTLTSASSLVGTTVTAPTTGDVVELWKDQSTNALTVWINGTQITAMNFTDATITSGLRPGFGFYPNNGNSATLLSFAADGVSVGSTGSGATTEASGDTASGSGVVPGFGSGSTTEASADSAASSGNVSSPTLTDVAQLTSKTALSGTELLAISDVNVAKSTTPNAILSLHWTGTGTVAALNALPKTLGKFALATNGRKSGEGASSGSGCPVWADGTNWRTFYDNSIVSA